MKKALKGLSKGLLACFMVLAIAPISATKVFAEDNTTSTTETTSTTNTTTNTDPKNIQVNSDTITVDSTGKEVEKKDTAITATGTTDTGTVTDAAGNKAEVTSGTAAPASTVTLDANGNPVDTRESADTTSTTETASTTTTTATDTTTTTTTTVTDTTVKTTETTSVDQQAIDAAGKDANTVNETVAVPKVNTGTVNGITYEVYASDKNDNPIDFTSAIDHYVISLTIGEEAEGDQSVDLSDSLVKAMDIFWKNRLYTKYALNYYKSWGYSSPEECYIDLLKDNPDYVAMPGDKVNIKVIVTAANGMKHTYQYDDQSFDLETAQADIHDYDKTGFVGYDGKEITTPFIGSYSNSAPIQALFKVTGSNNVTLKNKLDTYTVLKSLGYTKEKYANPLAAYLLNYYNERPEYAKADGTKYATFEELANECPKAMFNLFECGANCTYITAKTTFKSLCNNSEYKSVLYGNLAMIGSYDSSNYTVDVKWQEEPIAEASYNFFYHQYLQFGFDTQISSSDWGKIVQNYDTGYALSYYGDKESDQYKNVNTILNNSGTVNAENSMNYVMNFGLDWMTGNSLANKSFAVKNTFTLNCIDGEFTVTKVDENNNPITTGETGFILYLNDNGIRKYYSLGEDGKVSFTTDRTKAIQLTTEKGLLSVKYLLPGTYGLQEIIAPTGYYVNKTNVEFAVNSNSMTNVYFTDITPITNTTKNQETTTTVTKTVNSVTRPVVTPITPEPEPARPSTPTTPTASTTVTRTNTARPSTPSTGDETNVPLAAGGFAVSMMIAMMAVVLKKKVTE